MRLLRASKWNWCASLPVGWARSFAHARRHSREKHRRRAKCWQPRTAPSRVAGGRLAALGAAGLEVAQDVLAETQLAVLPLVPDLDTLRWVFIVVALAGIAVTIHARLDNPRASRS